MPALTSSQLNSILETSAKSIEIYMETQAQYEKILDILEELQKDNKDENKEHIDKIKELLKSLEEKLNVEHKKVLETTDKIEKTVSNQNKILIGAFVVIVLGIIGKIFGIPIP